MSLPSELSVPIARVFVVVEMESGVKVRISEQGVARNAQVFNRGAWKESWKMFESLNAWLKKYFREPFSV